MVWAWVDAAAPSLVGALAGGSITALVSWRTLKSSQAEERRLRREEREQEVAVSLLTALVEARTTLLDSSGALLATPEAATAHTRFKREMAISGAVLSKRGVSARLETLASLFGQTPAVLDALGLGEQDQAKAGIRLARDRISYLEWVTESVQRLAAGNEVGPEGEGPAAPIELDAEPWTPPSEQKEG